MKKEIETRLFIASKKLTDYTVIIEVEGKTITSKERGVKPVLALALKGEDISGAVVAERPCHLVARSRLNARVLPVEVV